MDVIWINPNMRTDLGGEVLKSHPSEVGVLSYAEFDSEIGSENAFSLTVPKRDFDKIAGTRGGMVYPVGAFEFGGKITGCTSNSEDGFVTFTGKTWLGMLGLHEVCTFAYSATGLRMDGYINDILARARMSGVMAASTDHVLQSVPRAYPFSGEVYSMLSVMKYLFTQAEQVPTITPVFADGVLSVRIGARDPKTYTALDFGGLSVPTEIEKAFQPVTNISISTVVNDVVQTPKYAWMDKDGVWQYSNTAGQVPGFYYEDFTGRQAALFVSEEEYAAFGSHIVQIVNSLQVSDTASVSASGSLSPDVGDYVTVRDDVTGIEATSEIASKTLHISDGVPVFSFQTAR